MSTRSSPLKQSFGSGAILLLVLAGTGRADGGVNAGYGPDAACSACHADIAASYRHVGMARSFEALSANTLQADLRQNHLYHPPSDRHYDVALVDDQLVITRYRLDPQGRRIHERSESVDFAIGSGNHSRGYLVRQPNGEMVQMPIVWLTRARRWAMAPGYDHPHHDDLDRPITRACLFCHNATPDLPPHGDAFGAPERWPDVLPEGIGCQRCHGPGAAHIATALDGAATLESVRDAIVNPAALPVALADDICMQCHLQPSSRLTTILRRFGRGDYAFRPGAALGSALVHLDVHYGAGPADHFEINHHPYRLRQSRCFLESGGTLRCVTCHDPHAVVDSGNHLAHYRTQCLVCHDTARCGADTDTRSARGDDCAGCHMPQRYTDDVVHVAMTDHRIQRPRPPGPRPSETPALPGGQRVPYFSDRSAAGDDTALYAVLAAALDGEPGSAPRLQAALTHSGSRALEPWVQLGLAQLQDGAADAARQTFRGLREHHPELALVHHNLGVAALALGAPDEAIAAFEQAIALDPLRAETHFDLGVAWSRRGDSDRARASYDAALAHRPHYAKAWFNRGNLSARSGDLEAAVADFTAALRADPDDLGACINLARAHEHGGHWRAAVAQWQAAAERHADDATAHCGLAQVLLAPGDAMPVDAAAGRDAAARCAALDPADPDGAVTLALAAAISDPAALPALRARAAAIGASVLDLALLDALIEIQRHSDAPQDRFSDLLHRAHAAPRGLTRALGRTLKRRLQTSRPALP